MPSAFPIENSITSMMIVFFGCFFGSVYAGPAEVNDPQQPNVIAKDDSYTSNEMPSPTTIMLEFGTTILAMLIAAALTTAFVRRDELRKIFAAGRDSLVAKLYWKRQTQKSDPDTDDVSGTESIVSRGREEKSTASTAVSFKSSARKRVIKSVDTGNETVPVKYTSSSTLSRGTQPQKNMLQSSTIPKIDSPQTKDAIDDVPTDCVIGCRVYSRERMEVLQPDYDLSENESTVLKEFSALLQAKIVGDQASREFCDQACLVRYLRARDWKIDPALKLLLSTLEWRREYAIESVVVGDIVDELQTGKIYIHGFDRFHRPVMYQRPRLENSKNYANQVKTVAYMLEREMVSMDLSKGVEQHTLIIDFKGYSIFNRPPMSVTKQVLSLLMDKYPERLGNAFMVDAPTLFWVCWKVVKPFLPPATKKKIFFVSRSGTAGRNGKMHSAFATVFDDDDLEEDFGGTLSSTYNAQKYIAHERKLQAPVQRWYGNNYGITVGYPPKEKHTVAMVTGDARTQSGTSSVSSPVPMVTVDDDDRNPLGDATLEEIEAAVGVHWAGSPTKPADAPPPGSRTAGNADASFSEAVRQAHSPLPLISEMAMTTEDGHVFPRFPMGVNAKAFTSRSTSPRPHSVDRASPVDALNTSSATAGRVTSPSFRLSPQDLKRMSSTGSLGSNGSITFRSQKGKLTTIV